MAIKIFITLLISAASIASSMPSDATHKLVARDPAAQLISIMPSAGSCTGATYAPERATADKAVAPLIASFAQYGVTTAPEQAALLAWQGYESADYKYNQNHFPAPGKPGQGTRTMMSPDFVSKYASSIPAVKSQMTGKDAAGILALVQPDQYSFGSAAWFYSTQCSDTIKQGVRTGGQAGWKAFLTECVQTTADEGAGDKSRLAYWQRACKALSVPTS